MFQVWDDYPPTNLLLKALLEGLGGGKKSAPVEEPEVSDEAQEAMRHSAMIELAQKAGNRLPIISGPDRGLPKSAPVFDIDEMRKRNAAAKAIAKGPSRV